MPSLAEINIIVHHYEALKIWVSDVVADEASFPRLRFNIKYKLLEYPDRVDHPLKDYELIDLEGDLRLSERQDTIGSLRWIGKRHQYNSTVTSSESHISMFCDLDLHRIEKIEQFRDGKGPVFWLELWPTFAGKGPFYNIDSRPARIVIPQDKWVQILDGIGYGDFEIIEITRGELDKELYSKSISYLKQAHSRLNYGDYDGCLMNCRKSIESMIKATPKGKGKQDEAFQAVLVKQVGADRASYLSGIISRVKKWTNIAAHSQGETVKHSRLEAQFVLNSTLNLLHLIGGLS